MTHWGWYWKVKKRHKRKKLCSELISIDSFKTFNNITYAEFSSTAPPFQGKITPNYIHFSVTSGPNIGTIHTIPLAHQPCNYGGTRTYFLCPHCSEHFQKLYYLDGFFSCRKCLHLSYRSQSLRPSECYEHMQTKIEKKLKQAGGDLHDKPNRMRHHTFRSLQDRHYDYDNKREEAFMTELLSMYGPQALAFFFSQ